MESDLYIECDVKLFQDIMVLSPPTIIFQDITSLPTGTILVERGTSVAVIYAQNDLHTHICLLVWVYIDDETFSLYYEKHRTKPFLLDMYIDHNNPKRHMCPVVLTEIECGNSISESSAYKPKKEVLKHPDYMTVVSKLINIFRVMFLRNACHAMFAHKYLPFIFSSYISSMEDMVQAYEYLKESDNLLKDAVDMNLTSQQSCIDIFALFTRLLHKELFPTSEPILTNTKSMLINDLLTDPQFYQVYAKDETPTMAIRTSREQNIFHWVYTGILTVMIVGFILCAFFLPNLLPKIFSFNRQTRHHRLLDSDNN